MSKKAISEWMRKLAKRKAALMSPAERTALANKMNDARWANHRAKGGSK